MLIEQFLNSNEIETDEFGRVVITDMELLKKINGGIGGQPEFMRPDAACGNSNCLC